MDQPTPSLEEIRGRIDEIDAELLRLVDERASLATLVAAAKKAAGDGAKFGLRPAREAQLMRRLLQAPRRAAGAALVVRLWRELMSDSLASQGDYHLTIWGGAEPARTVELARLRFGAAPPLRRAASAEDALAQAKRPGGVAVLTLAGDRPWWGRLLAEPELSVFAALPCLAAWGPTAALAVAAVAVEPSGDDDTLWVTDAVEPTPVIEAALSVEGVAASLVVESGGLKLFQLAGFYQREDARLARGPGRLSGVIGAVCRPFDL